MLVPLAAAAGAGIVTARRRNRRGIGGRCCQRRRAFGMRRVHIENTLEDRRGCPPLAHRHAIAAKLKELRRARDLGCEQPRQLHDFIGRHYAAEVEQSVKAEGFADRIRDLEGKCIRERFRAEDDAVLALEQRPEDAADRFVLGSGKLDPGILQRDEELPRAQRKASVADAHRVVQRLLLAGVPEPFGADVITGEKLGAPRRGIDDITVPLDEQNMCGVDMLDERFQNERRIRLARFQRCDHADVDARRVVRAVGQEQRAGEADSRYGTSQRAQRELGVRGIQAAERDAGELKHRRRPRCPSPRVAAPPAASAPPPAWSVRATAERRGR